MVVLTSLLGVLAVLIRGRDRKCQGFPQHSVDLGGVIGVFLAIDMFLFLYEMMLVPMLAS